MRTASRATYHEANRCRSGRSWSISFASTPSISGTDREGSYVGVDAHCWPWLNQLGAWVGGECDSGAMIEDLEDSRREEPDFVLPEREMLER